MGFGVSSDLAFGVHTGHLNGRLELRLQNAAGIYTLDVGFYLDLLEWDMRGREKALEQIQKVMELQGLVCVDMACRSG